jgi:DNA-directed RNA polymerase sigma subunit (sigma70/sigma32)
MATLKEYPENIIRELWVGHKATNINKNDFDKIEKRLEEKLFTLTDRERYAINLRFKQKMTFEKVGENLQNFHKKAEPVCKERARQIVNKALRKLRHPIRSGYILLNENDVNYGRIREYIFSLTNE